MNAASNARRLPRYDHQRVWADLLWSPSLAFNLFGDLASDFVLADHAVPTARLRPRDGRELRHRRRTRGCEGANVRDRAAPELQAASDWARRFAVGLRRDRLRANRVSVRLTPPRLVVAQPSPKAGHLGPAGDLVIGFPAVQSLELLLRQSAVHRQIVERSGAWHRSRDARRQQLSSRRTWSSSWRLKRQPTPGVRLAPSPAGAGSACSGSRQRCSRA